MSEYIYDINPEMIFDFVSLEGFSNAFLKNAKEEIVRCIKCKYFYCLTVDCCVCKRNGEKFMPWVEPDGFCKWGERKNDE